MNDFVVEDGIKSNLLYARTSLSLIKAISYIVSVVYFGVVFPLTMRRQFLYYFTYFV